MSEELAMLKDLLGILREKEDELHGTIYRKFEVMKNLITNRLIEAEEDRNKMMNEIEKQSKKQNKK